MVMMMRRRGATTMTSEKSGKRRVCNQDWVVAQSSLVAIKLNNGGMLNISVGVTRKFTVTFLSLCAYADIVPALCAAWRHLSTHQFDGPRFSLIDLA
jgi:hypothetical protein